MRFIDFTGNEKIKNQLTFLSESGRLPHAVILEGEEGLGKHTLAREIALNLLCRGEEKPCGKCPQCKKVNKGIHPDVIEYTAPDAPAKFSVNKVREIREDAFTKPNEADYKIYILGNCQSMTAAAQNALLKILEEPPSYVIFILLVTNKSAMLETVLSRSVVITLEGVSAAQGAEYISSRNESISFDEALNACEIWNGNIGKAQNSLSDGRLSKIGDITEKLATALLADNEYELIKAVSVFQKDSETLIASMSLLKAVFRDALTGGEDLMSGQREIVSALSSRLSRDKLLRLIEVCDNITYLTKRNGNNSIIITKLCYDLRRAIGR